MNNGNYTGHDHYTDVVKSMIQAEKKKILSSIDIHTAHPFLQNSTSRKLTVAVSLTWIWNLQGGIPRFGWINDSNWIYNVVKYRSVRYPSDLDYASN